MNYEYHRQENGNVVATYPLRNIHFENEKITGGGNDNLGIPVGLTVLHISCDNSLKTFTVDHSDDVLDSERFDDLFEKVTNIRGSIPGKKTRKNHKK